MMTLVIFAEGSACTCCANNCKLVVQTLCLRRSQLLNTVTHLSVRGASFWKLADARIPIAFYGTSSPFNVRSCSPPHQRCSHLWRITSCLQSPSTVDVATSCFNEDTNTKDLLSKMRRRLRPESHENRRESRAVQTPRVSRPLTAVPYAISPPQCFPLRNPLRRMYRFPTQE